MGRAHGDTDPASREQGWTSTMSYLSFSGWSSPFARVRYPNLPSASHDEARYFAAHLMRCPGRMCLTSLCLCRSCARYVHMVASTTSIAHVIASFQRSRNWPTKELLACGARLSSRGRPRVGTGGECGLSHKLSFLSLLFLPFALPFCLSRQACSPWSLSSSYLVKQSVWRSTGRARRARTVPACPAAVASRCPRRGDVSRCPCSEADGGQSSNAASSS